MAPFEKLHETRAVSIPSFTNVLWEAFERCEYMERPEYTLYKQEIAEGVLEFWARVVIFSKLTSNSRPYRAGQRVGPAQHGTARVEARPD